MNAETDRVPTSELMKLSVVEIFILQYLRRFQGSTIRITLLETLNAILDDAPISTSSFYARLDKLKDHGLVKYKTEPDTKTKLVDVTERGKRAMDFITRLSLIGATDFYGHTKKIFPDLIETIDLKDEEKESTLFINLEEGIDVRTMNLVEDISDQMFILADDETFERYSGRGISETIGQTKYDDQGTIREADHFFSTVVVVGYESGSNSLGKDQSHWLKQAYRVLKEEGLLVINSVASLPKSNHLIMENVAKLIEGSEFFKETSKNSIENEFQNLGIDKENVEMKNYKGIIFAWARK